MTTTKTTQYAIFGETWEVGGEMVESGMIDGPMNEIEGRGDREAWEKRLHESQTGRRRFQRDRNGPTFIRKNFVLQEREVTITVSDWAALPGTDKENPA